MLPRSSRRAPRHRRDAAPTASTVAPQLLLQVADGAAALATPGDAAHACAAAPAASAVAPALPLQSVDGAAVLAPPGVAVQACAPTFTAAFRRRRRACLAGW